ncbi:6990_t:CDS:1 [Ambispora leptoticha]|uniref:6990_t:CDS:1 n=1 Tax=Ambispora leptoticha TaxID=144679 RepID=A0A9N8ZY90_9GLOM|nr:6990_t:CDS:1 [Ambispora leptoticha]
MIVKISLFLNVVIILLESSVVLSTPIKRAVAPFLFGPSANKLEKIMFADNNFAASNSHRFFGPSSIADSSKLAHVAALDDAFIKRDPGISHFLVPEAEKAEKIFFADNNFAASASDRIFGPSSVADSAKKAHVAALDDAFIKRDPSVMHPLQFLGPEAEKIEEIFFADNVFAASSSPGISPGIFGPTSIADSSKKAHVAALDDAFIKRDPSVIHPLQFLGPEAEKIEEILFADNVFAASSSPGIFGPTSIADSSKKAHVAALDRTFI